MRFVTYITGIKGFLPSNAIAYRYSTAKLPQHCPGDYQRETYVHGFSPF